MWKAVLLDPANGAGFVSSPSAPRHSPQAARSPELSSAPYADCLGRQPAAHRTMRPIRFLSPSAACRGKGLHTTFSAKPDELLPVSIEHSSLRYANCRSKLREGVPMQWFTDPDAATGLDPSNQSARVIDRWPVRDHQSVNHHGMPPAGDAAQKRNPLWNVERVPRTYRAVSRIVKLQPTRRGPAPYHVGSNTRTAYPSTISIGAHDARCPCPTTWSPSSLALFGSRPSQPQAPAEP
jgi:hypothetical protein